MFASYCVVAVDAAAPQPRSNSHAITSQVFHFMAPTVMTKFSSMPNRLALNMFIFLVCL